MDNLFERSNDILQRFEEITRQLNMLRQIEEIDQKIEVQNIKSIEEYAFPKMDISEIRNQSEFRDLLEDLQCPICISIIEDPMCCVGCEVNYCKECITSWSQQKINNVCPTCRNKDQSLYIQGERIYYKKSSHIFKRILENVEVNCYNTGCNQVVKYNLRQNHIPSCQFQKVNCLNEGCTDFIIRKDLEAHIITCSYRKVICIHCQHKYAFINLENHIQKCAFNFRVCKSCMYNFQVEDFEKHRQQCKKINPLLQKPKDFDRKLKQRLIYKTIQYYDYTRSQLPININLLDQDKVLTFLCKK